MTLALLTTLLCLGLAGGTPLEVSVVKHVAMDLLPMPREGWSYWVKAP